MLSCDGGCGYHYSSNSQTLAYHSPQSISIVEPHEHHVCSELRLRRTELAMLATEITVHLLQCLQTLGQVLVVDFRVKD